MWLLLLFIYLTNRDRTIRGSLSRAGASQNILGPARAGLLTGLLAPGLDDLWKEAHVDCWPRVHCVS